MLQAAEVVKVFHHGNNVQLLCEDARGLLSVYMKPEVFIRFSQVVQRTGLKLKGLPVEFNRDMVRIIRNGKQRPLTFTPLR